MLTDSEANTVAGRADTVESWPVGAHVWGQYAEQITDRVAVCRTENVSACHPGVAALVEDPLCEIATGALAASAFKDKINYKHPGGAQPRRSTPPRPRRELRARRRALLARSLLRRARGHDASGPRGRTDGSGSARWPTSTASRSRRRTPLRTAA